MRLIKSESVLDRSVVYVGWASFALFAHQTWRIRQRLGVVTMVAPAERIAVVLGPLWFRATGMALAPVYLATVVASASGVTYQVYWAALVTFPLLALLIPSVGRIGDLGEARLAIDGTSVLAATSAPTVKINRNRRPQRSRTGRRID